MDLSLSYTPNFLSLEEIIATQVRVPCKTNTKIYGFGFLDPSLGSDDLPAGLELELPLWVAQFMSITRPYLSVNVPHNYKAAAREVLTADATVVDLNKMGPHFYTSGLNICSLPAGKERGSESLHVAQVLPLVLEQRLQALADSYAFITQFQAADEATSAKKGRLIKEGHMDALEARIYQDARAGSERMNKWLGSQ